MPKTEQEILERDAERDISAELLESIREMKSGTAGAVHSPVAIPRSHAPRGNAALDAPRPDSTARMPAESRETRRGAAEDAFPRGAWKRDQAFRVNHAAMTYTHPILTIAETPSFTRLWPDYWTEDERGELCGWLATNPNN